MLSFPIVIGYHPFNWTPRELVHQPFVVCNATFESRNARLGILRSNVPPFNVISKLQYSLFHKLFTAFLPSCWADNSWNWPNKGQEQWLCGHQWWKVCRSEWVRSIFAGPERHGLDLHTFDSWGLQITVKKRLNRSNTRQRSVTAFIPSSSRNLAVSVPWDMTLQVRAEFYVANDEEIVSAYVTQPIDVCASPRRLLHLKIRRGPLPACKPSLNF